MIRINLIEKRDAVATPKAARPKISVGFVGALSVLLVVAGFGAAAYQWWRLDQREKKLTTDIAAADQELADLKKVLQTMGEHQTKKKELEHRVELISNLKRRQNVPVQLLDMLSRQVPDFLWLESLDERSGAISLKGKATTYNAVSNFYNNLRDSGCFADVTLGATSKAKEGVSFALSCKFAPPAAPGAPAAAGQAASAADGASAAPRG